MCLALLTINNFICIITFNAVILCTRTRKDISFTTSSIYRHQIQFQYLTIGHSYMANPRVGFGIECKTLFLVCIIVLHTWIIMVLHTRAILMVLRFQIVLHFWEWLSFLPFHWLTGSVKVPKGFGLRLDFQVVGNFFAYLKKNLFWEWF